MKLRCCGQSWWIVAWTWRSTSFPICCRRIFMFWISKFFLFWREVLGEFCFFKLMHCCRYTDCIWKRNSREKKDLQIFVSPFIYQCYYCRLKWSQLVTNMYLLRRQAQKPSPEDDSAQKDAKVTNSITFRPKKKKTNSITFLGFFFWLENN